MLCRLDEPPRIDPPSPSVPDTRGDDQVGRAFWSGVQTSRVRVMTTLDAKRSWNVRRWASKSAGR